MEYIYRSNIKRELHSTLIKLRAKTAGYDVVIHAAVHCTRHVISSSFLGLTSSFTHLFFFSKRRQVCIWTHHSCQVGSRRYTLFMGEVTAFFLWSTFSCFLTNFSRPRNKKLSFNALSVVQWRRWSYWSRVQPTPVSITICWDSTQVRR